MTPRTFNVYDIVNGKTYYIEGVDELSRLVEIPVDQVPQCRIGAMVLHDSKDGVLGQERWRVVECKALTPEEAAENLKKMAEAYWSTPNTSKPVKEFLEKYGDK